MSSPHDAAVLDAITRLREQHHACTAAAVAGELRMSRAYMHEIIGDLAQRGLVTWSPEMIGSLRVLTPEPEQADDDDRTTDEDASDDEGKDELSCASCDFTAKSGAGLVAHFRAKHAA